jgi:RNA polymerase sigma factor (sigma-70 family)
MVFNVCYQILKDSHDAEDATQAVFLALAVQAKTTNGVKYLAPWLQKVAQRLSLDVRRSKTRRKAREERHSQMRLQMGIENDPTARPGMDELKVILRDELDKLPSKYRLPLVLHYFGGLKPEEISKELGCKPSTLGVRLHRGRKMLADLLSERGIVVNGSMLSIALAACVQARISETLVHTTAHAAGAYAMQGSFAAVVTPQVMGFKQIASQGIFLAKVKAAVAAGILAAAAAAGAAELVNRVVPEAWRFNIRNELREWLKPTFVSPSRDFRAVAAIPQVVEPVAVNTDTQGFVGNLSFPMPTGIETTQYSETLSAPTSVAVGAIRATTTDLRDTPYGETTTPARAPDATLPAPVTRASAPKNVDVPSIASSGENAINASTSSAAAAGGASRETGSRATNLIAPPPALVVHNPNGTTQAPQQPFMPRDSQRVSIASSAGEVKNFVYNKPSKVSTENFSVGGQGVASLVAQSGTFSIGNSLIAGDSFGGTGAITFANSSVAYVPNAVAGEDGCGVISMTGRAQLYANNITIGRNSSGTFNLAGGSLDGKSLDVGKWNTGLVQQTGGVARLSNFLGHVGLAQLGVGPSSEGTYYLQGGILEAGKQSIGVGGRGHLYVSGGLNNVQTLEQGVKPGSSGSVQLPSGTIQFIRSQPGSPVLNEWVVGRMGRGEVVLGSENSEASVNEVGYGKGTDLIIRASRDGSGLFIGHGQVRLTGILDQSGTVIADGFGSVHTLDFSTFDAVVNSFDNQADGTNGWYARNKGILRLPLNRAARDGSLLVDNYTFGEAGDDTSLDLVNALRVVFDPQLDVSTPVSVSLVSPELAPSAFRNGSFVSVYETNFASLPAGTASLAIRYDAVAIGNHTPRLLSWRDGQWLELGGLDVSVDRANHLILASTIPANFYAISVPEPLSTSTLLLLGTALMSRRRRA